MSEYPEVVESIRNERVDFEKDKQHEYSDDDEVKKK